MIFSPKTAIQQKWITHADENFDWEKYTQPNAIDFTLDRAFTVDADKEFIISETSKSMRGGVELFANTFLPDHQQAFFTIFPREVIDGVSNFYVNIPEGVAALFIIRSTLNRNGLFITSGLYDSGFKGHIGYAIHNDHSAAAHIAPGTRVGQIMFVESQNAGVYTGQWNHDMGTHYTEKK